MLARTPSPYTGCIEDFIAHAQILNRYLSAETKAVLEKISACDIKCHQFLNIPVTEIIPPTPVAYTARIPKQTYQAEGVIGAVSLSLGSLFGYEETSKFVMYDIYPVKGYEKSRSFVNSKKMLSFHTDGSAHPKLSPDFVLLYCIRSDDDAVNWVADLDVLLQQLPSEVTGLLMRPLFKHLVCQSPEEYIVKPILFRDRGVFTIQYDEDNVFGTSPEAIESQAVLNSILRKVAVKIENRENSLLVVNNRRCVHARSSFTPKFAGEDRWIKGAFVTKEAIKNGSILARYSANS